ncbi:MAG: hypothetical protein ACLP8X_10625 [Streptosporangiaceae bacterium]
MNGPARGGVLVLTALDLEYQAVRAHLGAVLDQDDLAERIRHLLDLLTAIDAPAPARVAPAVGIEPAMLLSEGRVADLPRARATIGHRRAPHVRVPAEDALPFAGLTGRSLDVAEELAARLLARFRQERS